MQELLNGAVLEIAAALVSLVVAVVVGYLAKTTKAVLDSQQTKKYTEALERFDPMISQAVRQLAMSALAKVEDAGDSLTDGEARDWVRERALDYAVEFRARTGIEFDPNIVVDKVLDEAIVQARKSWIESYGYGS